MPSPESCHSLNCMHACWGHQKPHQEHAVTQVVISLCFSFTERTALMEILRLCRLQIASIARTAECHQPILAAPHVSLILSTESQLQTAAACVHVHQHKASARGCDMLMAPSTSSLVDIPHYVAYFSTWQGLLSIPPCPRVQKQTHIKQNPEHLCQSRDTTQV